MAVRRSRRTTAAALLSAAAFVRVVAPGAPAAAATADGAWVDLGSDGPSGVVAGAVTSAGLVVVDNATNTVWTYASGGWDPVASEPGEGPGSATGAAVAAAGDRLWLFGGSTPGGADADELWSWGPGTSGVGGGWRREVVDGRTPGPRSGAAMTSDGRALYLYGGSRSGTLRDDLWRYDTETGGWDQLPQCRGAGCPGPRRDAGFAAFEGALWLHGGSDGEAQVDTLHRALGDGTWELVSAGSAGPPPVAGHGLVPAGDALVATGGCTDAGALTWRYEPGEGWRQLHPTPLAPGAAGAAVLWDGERVHLVGGRPCGASPSTAALHVALEPGEGTANRVERIGADATDPVALGVAVSRAVFPDRSATTAVVCTALRFPDCLAGAPLVWGPGGADGPLLFSAQDHLSAAAADELRRAVRRGSEVLLLGGESALSQQVSVEIAELGLEPTRVSGPTRVETGVAVATRADQLRDLVGEGGTVLLADSRGYADAVGAGGWAAGPAPVPVLLTPGDAPEVHPAVAEAIGAFGVDRVLLLGGRAALSDSVEASVRALGVDVERIAGGSRDATTALMAQELWGRDTATRGAGYVAVGLFDDTLSWAAALAAAPLAATASAPLLALNANSPDDVPPGTRAHLTALGWHADRPAYAWIVGPAPAGAVAALTGLLGR